MQIASLRLDMIRAIASRRGVIAWSMAFRWDCVPQRALARIEGMRSQSLLADVVVHIKF